MNALLLYIVIVFNTCGLLSQPSFKYEREKDDSKQSSILIDTSSELKINICELNNVEEDISEWYCSKYQLSVKIINLSCMVLNLLDSLNTAQLILFESDTSPPVHALI